MRQRLALTVLLVAVFMDILDSTIVNVALPAIQRDLGLRYTSVQWVVAGYTLTFALMLVTGGRLGDLLGRKRTFLAGMTAFALASAACGLATSGAVLVGARLVQGVAAALMVPQVLATMHVTLPPERRAGAFVLYGAIAGTANVAGPLLGGLLIRLDLFGLGWRPIFLINLPVAAIALVVAGRLLPETRAEDRVRLDVVGVVLATLGLLVLLFPVLQGRELGWPAWGFGMLAAAVPLGAAFVWWERRKHRRDGFALVPPTLVARRSFAAGLAVLAGFLAGIAGLLLLLTLYLQQGLGFSALHTGVVTLPWPVGVSFAAATSTRLLPRFGRRVITGGVLLMLAGLGCLLLVLAWSGTAVSGWQLAPALLVCGVGMGFVIAPATDLVLSAVPHRDAGTASGVLNASIQVGPSVGVAALGTAFFVHLGDARTADAFTTAMRTSLWYAAAFFTVILALTFLLPRTAARSPAAVDEVA